MALERERLSPMTLGCERDERTDAGENPHEP